VQTESARNWQRRISYLAVSFISGFLELGIVILLLRSSETVANAILAALAYQLGGFLNELSIVRSWALSSILLLSAVLAIWAAKSALIMFVSVTMLSFGIQAVRALLSGDVTTLIKRTSRVAGFACAGFFCWSALSVLGIVSLIALAIAPRHDKHMWLHNKATLPGLRSLEWTMVLHQAHYFSYAYIVAVVLVRNYWIDPRIAGSLFSIGWLSYMFSKRLFGEFHLARSFVVGHIIVILSLTGMLIFAHSSLVLFLFCWLMTGFGGGTVFCLKGLIDEARQAPANQALWEGLGHVLGVVVCLVILISVENPLVVLPFSALIAALTIVQFLIPKHYRTRQTDRCT
jgi:hypothetical protein